MLLTLEVQDSFSDYDLLMGVVILTLLFIRDCDNILNVYSDLRGWEGEGSENKSTLHAVSWRIYHHGPETLQSVYFKKM